MGVPTLRTVRSLSDSLVDYSSPSVSPATVGDDDPDWLAGIVVIDYADDGLSCDGENENVNDSETTISTIDALFKKCIEAYVSNPKEAEEDLKLFLSSKNFTQVSPDAFNRAARCSTITDNQALLEILLASSRKNEIEEKNTSE